MISFFRTREREPFLCRKPIRNSQEWAYAYPTLRQGLLQFLKPSPPKIALLPTYVPEGIYHPLRFLGCQIIYYDVDINLKVNKLQLETLVHTHNPDLFLYIHYFGLYDQENLRLVRGILPTTILFLEDFAHSLPEEGLPLIGDIGLFALTKLLGVPEGSFLKFREGKPPRLGQYTSSPGGVILARKLRKALWLNNILSRPSLGRRWHGLACKTLLPLCDYYPYLMANYPTAQNAIELSTRYILDRMDFSAISARRKQMTLAYLKGLDARFLLDMAEDCYTAQAMLAFPIRVANPTRLQCYLYRKGIVGFQLHHRWWFREGEKSEFVLRHCLLPINHYLKDKHIAYVIRCTNEYRE